MTFFLYAVGVMKNAGIFLKQSINILAHGHALPSTLFLRKMPA
jgi:hypothetical protein